MDEPLWCWTVLLAALLWGYFTQSKAAQEKMMARFGKYTPCFQWYNVAFMFLLLLFLKTLGNIAFYEYYEDKFLRWSIIKTKLDTIPLSTDEKNFDRGPLVIPSWIGVLSLLSPLAGLVAFAYTAFQVYDRIVHNADRNETLTTEQRSLNMIVRGMPLVFIVMAMRATVRQWAVMTGSCWQEHWNLQLFEQRNETWNNLKAAELSTYTQDLEVASGFQFFAVWCFGQVCRRALRSVVVAEAARAARNRNSPVSSFQQQSTEQEAETRDARILLQLGILGLHSFVAIGVVKTVVNMIIAVASALFSDNTKMMATIRPIQEMFLHTVDPVFMFATVLSVINMVALGKMHAVDKALPNLNMKFNATRALLLIGQGQLTLLRAASTDSAQGSKLLAGLKHISYLKDLNWWFGANQARLLHSSLLCFECLLVVIVNDLTWRRLPQQAAAKEGDPRRAPLLDC